MVWALLLAAAPAHAHDGYSNWINKANRGCCNNHDCAPIADADVRDAGPNVEVRIQSEWCRVFPYHYLQTGNAPDWNTAHICIQKSNHLSNTPSPRFGKGATVCHTLLCFQPKPQF